MEEINYLLIAAAALVSIASPGPATLAIMSLSMSKGRSYGTMIALGILTGSLSWSIAAALGMGAVMQANAWVFEILRIVGALYLIYLSYRSLRSAFISTDIGTEKVEAISLGAAYRRGLLIHLTNPKAILFFGALYTLALPVGATAVAVISVFLFVGAISAGIFLGYAIVFSSETVRDWYMRSRQLFNISFGVLFGIAGVRLLVTRLNGSS